MRAVHIERAAGKLRDIRDLERDRDGSRFGLELGARFKDDAMLAAVDAAIKGELQRRIDGLKAELRELGVEID